MFFGVCNPQCLYIIKCAENEHKKKGLELLIKSGKGAWCPYVGHYP